jgi:hypothetical protein
VNSYAKTQNGSCRRTELAGKFISSTLKMKKRNKPLVKQKGTHPWRMENLLVANLTWQLMNE